MRRVIATVVGTVIALVLLLSFKTHSLTSSGAAIPPAAISPSSSAAPPSATPSASASGQVFPSAGPSAAAPTTAKKPAAPTKATGNRTVDGDAVDTRYGPVQVRVALSGATITGITILQVPSDRQRDIEINDYAVPILTQEALKAQSTQIDMVSGATYTSQGYLQSLQSALDKAKAS
jgi:uncharacterized protein with FMN-binding domain